MTVDEAMAAFEQHELQEVGLVPGTEQAEAYLAGLRRTTTYVRYRNYLRARLQLQRILAQQLRSDIERIRRWLKAIVQGQN